MPRAGITLRDISALRVKAKVPSRTIFSGNDKYDKYLAWEELLIEQDLLYESFRYEVFEIIEF